MPVTLYCIHKCTHTLFTAAAKLKLPIASRTSKRGDAVGAAVSVPNESLDIDMSV
jgi:hypothetical protein